MSGVTNLLMDGGARILIGGATYTVTDIVASPTDATAGLTLEADGDIVQLIGAAPTDIGDWINPKGAAGAAYECRMTVVSGSVTTGTTGSWLALSSDRGWTRSRTLNIAGVDAFVGTLEIRRATDLVVLGTATVDLTAEVT